MQKNKQQIGIEFWERMNTLIKGDNPYSWAVEMGMNKSTFQSAMGRGTKPLDKTVAKWAEKIGVDYTWLNTGIGQPYPAQPNTSSKLTDGIPIDEVEYIPVSVWDDDTPLDDDEIEIPFYKDLEFACGHGATNLVIDQDETRKLRIGILTLRRLGIQASNAFAATTREHSMTPTINKGSTIWVDRGRTSIKDGKIFAIEWGDMYVCKRLYKAPNGGVRIVSDNNYEYPERTLTAEQIRDQAFRIIGWVWHWSVIETW